MENRNIKTTICSFWKKGNCKYMKQYEECLFAHGVKDLKKVECLYKNDCININCPFLHIKIEKTFDLIDFVKDKKIKNKKTKGKLVEIKSKNNENTEINQERENIKICKKNVLNNNIHIPVHEKDLNKLLNYVDLYYLTKIEKDNEELKSKIINLENTINDLKNKKNTINNVVKNKTIKIYEIENDNFIKKYYNLGKILIEKKNKIDVDHIKSFFNCKNISMVKNRCNRVYILITYMKENNFKFINISLRNILHMNKDTFWNNLKTGIFFN